MTTGEVQFSVTRAPHGGVALPSGLAELVATVAGILHGVAAAPDKLAAADGRLRELSAERGYDYDDVLQAARFGNAMMDAKDAGDEAEARKAETRLQSHVLQTWGTSEDKQAVLAAYMETIPADRRYVAKRALTDVFGYFVKCEEHAGVAEAALREGRDETFRAAMARITALTRPIAVCQATLADFDLDAGATALHARLKVLRAESHLLQALTDGGVPAVVRQWLHNECGEDRYPEQWAGIRQQCASAYGDLGSVDQEHLLVYIRTMVGWAASRDDGKMEPALLDTLDRAKEAFASQYVRTPVADYAPGVTGEKVRLLHGAECADHLPPDLFERWLTDVQAFTAAGARHEHSAHDVAQVRQACVAASARHGAKLEAHETRKAELEAELAELTCDLARLSRVYAAGPAHIVALEQQWLAYRANAEVLWEMKRPGEATPYDQTASLQPVTLDALKRAAAYSWDRMPIEAVASASEGLLPEMAISPEALGALGVPGAAGWWWFQPPIPMRTSVEDAAILPVVALLWRREHPKTGPARTWLSTFVLTPMAVRGRKQPVPTPSMSWYWPDGMPLSKMEAFVRDGYRTASGVVSVTGRLPADLHVADEAVFLEAGLWFSRFFLAATAWLRQRIVGLERGQGTRNIGRTLQREHKLAEPPRVQVVHLRKRDVVHRAEPAADDGTPKAKRSLHCRFTVRGFWRNQWYPSTGTHAPKYIDSFLKGPADAPLVTRTKVFAVVR
jgi:hypothetical protein